MKLVALKTYAKAVYLKGKKIHNPPLKRPRKTIYAEDPRGWAPAED